MSVHDDLTSVQRSLEDLLRALGRLEQGLGGDGGLELRRVRSDANHLRESVALLRETAPALARRTRPDTGPPLVPMSDTPYDSALWTDSDDEGLGAHQRRSP
ncbi:MULTISPECIES: hypothetical protein [unclassified Streptomyces]|uniref:hypothetical protein n=1 Tax=unclassified Streptomyces TaxID=2593676 RepID=UPI0037F5FE1D